MRFRYYNSRGDRGRKKPSAEVTAMEWGKVGVGISFSGSVFAVNLDPQQARDMAAALIERATDAEQELIDRAGTD